MRMSLRYSKIISTRPDRFHCSKGDRERQRGEREGV